MERAETGGTEAENSTTVMERLCGNGGALGAGEQRGGDVARAGG